MARTSRQPEVEDQQDEAETMQINENTFPPLNRPRVWFITKADGPIGTAVAKHLLQHGDWVMAGVAKGGEDVSSEWIGLAATAEKQQQPNNVTTDPSSTESGIGKSKGKAPMVYGGRLRFCTFDIGSMADCQSATAAAIEAFGRLDVLLCCNSEAVVGTIEELAATPATRSLFAGQLSANFFSPVNIIKTVLPPFRSQMSGHIILLTGITGHLGTPGLAAFCASQWAIEGYCDSLAYEIAPFGIRMSIVQNNIEVGLLTNRITAAPELDAYSPPRNEAPLARGWLGGLADRLADASTPESVGFQHIGTSRPSKLLHDKTQITTFQPQLPVSFKNTLIAETVHALLAIGGHENPPSRHIVGFEGVASVKEKIKTVHEELEEFLECSAAVDY